jgi:hypothetical protein
LENVPHVAAGEELGGVDCAEAEDIVDDGDVDLLARFVVDQGAGAGRV